MRSMPARRVYTDDGHVPQAPTSWTLTTPASSSTSTRKMSPPSACSAGRMTSMVASTCSLMTPSVSRSRRAIRSVGTSRRSSSAKCPQNELMTPLDVGAQGAELVDEVLVAAVDVVGGAHDGLAVGAEAGHHQRGPGPDVVGLHRRARQAVDTTDDRVMALDPDVGAHAGQLVDVAEAAGTED